jgi:prepilin-type N-terminal cleavage/methylation domain-containing protein
MMFGKDQRGVTLIEITIALAIFLIGLLALAQAIVGVVVLNSKNRELTRVATMCKDKAEQLISLDFSDTTTNTAVEPTGDPLVYPATGVGLANGGTNPPATPIAGYVDYLNQDGKRVASTSSDARFKRQWRISQNGSMKTIVVTVTGNSSAAFKNAKVITYKSN